MAEVTNFQIQGPVVVLPLEEYLEIQKQIEEYQRLKAIYDPEREARFQQLFQIAERHQDVSPEEVETEVSTAVHTIWTE